jgi:general stress protein 26
MTTLDGDPDFARVRELLAGHNTLSLATTGEDGAWAASVFYASDERCNLYFVSDLKTRHGRDMSREERVVAAINRDVATWDEVIGLQIEGRAEVLSGIPRRRWQVTWASSSRCDGSSSRRAKPAKSSSPRGCRARHSGASHLTGYA